MSCAVQHVEIVLTAHPTQVNRRTLQYKHMRIAALLAQNDRQACIEHLRCCLYMGWYKLATTAGRAMTTAGEVGLLHLAPGRHGPADNDSRRALACAGLT